MSVPVNVWQRDDRAGVTGSGGKQLSQVAFNLIRSVWHVREIHYGTNPSTMGSLDSVHQRRPAWRCFLKDTTPTLVQDETWHALLQEGT